MVLKLCRASNKVRILVPFTTPIALSSPGYSDTGVQGPHLKELWNKELLKKKKKSDFPGSPMVRTLYSNTGASIWSLVRELGYSKNQKELIWIFPRGGCGGEGIGAEEERPGPNFKTRKQREMKGMEKMF